MQSRQPLYGTSELNKNYPQKTRNQFHAIINSILQEPRYILESFLSSTVEPANQAESRDWPTCTADRNMVVRCLDVSSSILGASGHSSSYLSGLSRVYRRQNVAAALVNAVKYGRP